MPRYRHAAILIVVGCLLLAGCGGDHKPNEAELHGRYGGPKYKLVAYEEGGKEGYFVEWYVPKTTEEGKSKQIVIVILDEENNELPVAANEAEVEFESSGKTKTYVFKPEGEGVDGKHARFAVDYDIAVSGALGAKTGHTHIHVTIDDVLYEAHVEPHSHSH